MIFNFHSLDNRDLNVPMLASKLNVEFYFNASFACPGVICLLLLMIDASPICFFISLLHLKDNKCVL